MTRSRIQPGVLIFAWALCAAGPAAANAVVRLPEPRLEGDGSLEEVIAARRSAREFSASPVSLEQVGQLLWAAQGITDPRGLRAAPSAGALYPLELYLVAGKVADLAPGVYCYRPQRHALERVAEGDKRAALASAAHGQSWVGQAPIVIVMTGVYGRTTRKYGERGVRYVHVEAGDAAQNVLLQATALGLRSVVVGAFRDDAVRDTLGLPDDHAPLLLLPLGNP
jgi:SagB-type dehydrogenase family enzyme